MKHTARLSDPKYIPVFDNDPLVFMRTAFDNLYPDKAFEAFVVDNLDDHADENGQAPFGCTVFPDDGIPQILLSAQLKYCAFMEVFAHEMAHVAVGIDAEHDPSWEAAFDSIFNEYMKIIEEAATE